MTSVLFVCLGNICRSPTAQAVFSARAAYAGLDISVDSAGTSGWHTEKPPDSRAQKYGAKRGYLFSNIKARVLQDEDFEKFDYILAMDLKNLEVIRDRMPKDYQGHTGLFLDFAQDLDVKEVPDPYYSGAESFERVLDMIELACGGLISDIKTRSDLPSSPLS